MLHSLTIIQDSFEFFSWNTNQKWLEFSRCSRRWWKIKAVGKSNPCGLKMEKSNSEKKLTNFVRKQVLLINLSALYTLQQNEVSERRNIYIMEMTRSLLHEKVLPKSFWAEGANTTIFLQNRLPTKVLQNKTLFEAWNGFKPSLSFI